MIDKNALPGKVNELGRLLAQANYIYGEITTILAVQEEKKEKYKIGFLRNYIEEAKK